MKTWIITGGIGTGKSAFIEALRKAPGGALHFFSADEAVHHAYERREVRAAIARTLDLPATSVDDTGADFRVQVRSQVLAKQDKKRQIESILHPLVWKAFVEEGQKASSAGAKVLVAEVPLYYETSAAVAADCVITVAASRAMQLHRLQSHRSLDSKTCEDLLMMQLPLEQKIERADVVIWNDGSLSALEEQALMLLRQANLNT